MFSSDCASLCANRSIRQLWRLNAKLLYISKIVIDKVVSMVSCMIYQTTWCWCNGGGQWQMQDFKRIASLIVTIQHCNMLVIWEDFYQIKLLCLTLTLWCPLLPLGIAIKLPVSDWVAVICNFWHTGTVSECPDVKNYKWLINLVWHRVLYRCTHGNSRHQRVKFDKSS